MTPYRRKLLALKILSTIDEIVVVSGAEQLKLDMEALLRDIATKVEKGEQVEVGGY